MLLPENGISWVRVTSCQAPADAFTLHLAGPCGSPSRYPAPPGQRCSSPSKRGRLRKKKLPEVTCMAEPVRNWVHRSTISSRSAREYSSGSRPGGIIRTPSSVRFAQGVAVTETGAGVTSTETNVGCGNSCRPATGSGSVPHALRNRKAMITTEPSISGSFVLDRDALAKRCRTY